MNMRIISPCIVGLLLFTTSLVPSMASVGQATSGRITGGMVNIRSRPSMTGTVVTSLASGSEVYSLADSYSSGWKKMEVPVGAHLWVSRTYIDANGVVTANRLNVRTGPGSYHDSLGLVPRGTTVEILGQAYNWYMISAPRGLTAYVASYLVNLDSSSRPPETLADANQKAVDADRVTEIQSIETTSTPIKVTRKLSPGQVLNSRQILSDLWPTANPTTEGVDTTTTSAEGASSEGSTTYDSAIKSKNRWRWLKRLLRRE